MDHDYIKCWAHRMRVSEDVYIINQAIYRPVKWIVEGASPCGIACVRRIEHKMHSYLNTHTKHWHNCVLAWACGRIYPIQCVCDISYITDAWLWRIRRLHIWKQPEILLRACCVACTWECILHLHLLYAYRHSTSHAASEMHFSLQQRALRKAIQANGKSPRRGAKQEIR